MRNQKIYKASASTFVWWDFAKIKQCAQAWMKITFNGVSEAAIVNHKEKEENITISDNKLMSNNANWC